MKNIFLYLSFFIVSLAQAKDNLSQKEVLERLDQRKAQFEKFYERETQWLTESFYPLLGALGREEENLASLIKQINALGSIEEQLKNPQADTHTKVLLMRSQLDDLRVFAKLFNQNFSKTQSRHPAEAAKLLERVRSFFGALSWARTRLLLMSNAYAQKVESYDSLPPHLEEMIRNFPKFDFDERAEFQAQVDRLKFNLKFAKKQKSHTRWYSAVQSYGRLKDGSLGTHLNETLDQEINQLIVESRVPAQVELQKLLEDFKKYTCPAVTESKEAYTAYQFFKTLKIDENSSTADTFKAREHLTTIMIECLGKRSAIFELFQRDGSKYSRDHFCPGIDRGKSNEYVLCSSDGEVREIEDSFVEDVYEDFKESGADEEHGRAYREVEFEGKSYVIDISYSFTERSNMSSGFIWNADAEKGHQESKEHAERVRIYKSATETTVETSKSETVDTVTTKHDVSLPMGLDYKPHETFSYGSRNATRDSAKNSHKKLENLDQKVAEKSKFVEEVISAGEAALKRTFERAPLKAKHDFSKYKENIDPLEEAKIIASGEMGVVTDKLDEDLQDIAVLTRHLKRKLASRTDISEKQKIAFDKALDLIETMRTEAENKMRTGDREGAEELVHGAKSLLEAFGPAILDVSLSMTPLVGDIKDFLEASTGYDMQGNKLSLGQRLAAGAGLIVGNRAFWELASESLVAAIRIADKIPLGKATVKGKALPANIADYPGHSGLTGEDLKVFQKDIKNHANSYASTPASSFVRKNDVVLQYTRPGQDHLGEYFTNFFSRDSDEVLNMLALKPYGPRSKMRIFRAKTDMPVYRGTIAKAPSSTGGILTRDINGNIVQKKGTVQQFWAPKEINSKDFLEEIGKGSLE